MHLPSDALLSYIRDNNKELFDELDWSMSLQSALGFIAEYYGLDSPKPTDTITDACERLLSEIIAQEDDLK